MVGYETDEGAFVYLTWTKFFTFDQRSRAFTNLTLVAPTGRSNPENLCSGFFLIRSWIGRHHRLDCGAPGRRRRRSPAGLLRREAEEPQPNAGASKREREME